MGEPDGKDPDLAELVRSEERFRTICQNAPVMIDAFEEDGTCTLWNEECERRLGWTREEIAASPEPLALAYPDPADRARVMERIRRADGAWREYTVTAKDGSRRVQLWADFALPTGTRISVGHDVTEQRALEEQLRQSQKMQALGELAGGLAHDFNNLLTVILGNLELAQRRRTDTELAQRALADAIAATMRGVGLTKRLLAFSHAGSLSPERLDLNRALSEQLSLLRGLIPCSIDIQLTTDASLPEAMVDRVALQQIVMGLATNARDAMPDGGRLVLSTRRVWLDEGEAGPERGAGAYAEVCVIDDGAGMDDETLRRACEPFFTRKPVGAGAGLGLTMVYGLMRQHRGAMEIESEAGRGTTVRLSFPSAAERSSDRPRSPSRARARILIVDDDPASRAVLDRVLRSEGHEVVQAPDGEKALAMLRQPDAGIELVITDVIMPRMTGPALHHATRELERPPPFVFVTGQPARGDVAPELDPSVAILQKPWTIDRVLATVERALARGRSAP